MTILVFSSRRDSKRTYFQRLLLLNQRSRQGTGFKVKMLNRRWSLWRSVRINLQLLSFNLSSCLGLCISVCMSPKDRLSVFIRHRDNNSLSICRPPMCIVIYRTSEKPCWASSPEDILREVQAMTKWKTTMLSRVTLGRRKDNQTEITTNRHNGAPREMTRQIRTKKMQNGNGWVYAGHILTCSWSQFVQL